MAGKKKGSNFWDVAMKAIDRGQFPLFALWSVLLVVLLRVSSRSLERWLEHYVVWGWGLWFVTLGGWLLHVRWLRKKYLAEIDRLSDEKKKLQELLARRKLPSSKGRKKK